MNEKQPTNQLKWQTMSDQQNTDPLSDEQAAMVTEGNDYLDYPSFLFGWQECWDRSDVHLSAVEAAHATQLKLLTRRTEEALRKRAFASRPPIRYLPLHGKAAAGTRAAVLSYL